jgi:hypothetical protein
MHGICQFLSGDISESGRLQLPNNEQSVCGRGYIRFLFFGFFVDRFCGNFNNEELVKKNKQGGIS